MVQSFRTDETLFQCDPDAVEALGSSQGRVRGIFRAVGDAVHG